MVLWKQKNNQTGLMYMQEVFQWIDCAFRKFWLVVSDHCLDVRQWGGWKSMHGMLSIKGQTVRWKMNNNPWTMTITVSDFSAKRQVQLWRKVHKFWLFVYSDDREEGGGRSNLFSSWWQEKCNQRLQLAGSSSTVFAVYLILYYWDILSRRSSTDPFFLLPSTHHRHWYYFMDTLHWCFFAENCQ